VILVTIGTNEQPFDRLVLAAAALDVGEPVVVQYGSSRAVEPREGWHEFMPFDDLSALAAQASAVVCHAGVGSILMARGAGKKAIVMARRHNLGEAVDDHQVGLAQQLGRNGLVTIVDDQAELDAAVRTAIATKVGPPSGVPGLPGGRALAVDLRAHLDRIAA
jgi:UDP-N-acetylglucosamine transferase subunit ALG13